MRNGFLATLLAVSAVTVSGCQTTSPNTDSSGVAAASGSGTTTTTGGTTAGTTTTTFGTGTGTGTGTPTGSATGTSTGQVVSNGSTSFAFNDSAATTDGSAGTQVTITNAGAGNESARVAVDVSSAGLTWADPITLPFFKRGINSLPGVPELGGNYKEYRKITADTDAELQIWRYANSRIGQYTVYSDPSAPNNNNTVLFFDGNATSVAALPAATATYNGNFGGTAVASNWASRNRSIDDPFDTNAVAGSTWSPNGTWRVTGNSQVTADFGAGRVTGSINNTTWRRFDASPTSPDGYITVGTGETSRPFHNYRLSGRITGNTYSGNVSGPSGRVVTGDNALQGGFFGPNAEETAGVIRSFTTSPGPRDGISPYEENRRGFIDIRGVFQGTR